MLTFPKYYQAHAAALTRASESGIDVGLTKSREHGRVFYTIRYLPLPANRFGTDLRCEVIRPTIIPMLGDSYA